MSPEEINFLRSALSGFGLGALLAAGVAWVVIKQYAAPYLGRKAQNLADKEDIATLTQQVEQVKRQHSEILEAVKARNQLRMAAVDRRLQAHQDAFTMLRELAKHGFGPEIGKRVAECQEWWGKNCLYLEPQARAAFSNAYFAAGVHQTLLKSSGFPTNPSPEQAKQHIEHLTANWNRVKDALNIVLDSVALPPLTPSEAEGIAPSADA